LATKFVLVDLENHQLKEVGALNGGALKVKVFLGAHQVKIPLDLARTLQVFGPDAEYIPIDGNGSNALDFHIAFYIGRLAALTPGAEFYVVSRTRASTPSSGMSTRLGQAIASTP